MKPKPAIQKQKLQKQIHPFPLHLPPGTQLSDVFIDGAQVIAELFISKRTLLNWRSTGKISYCDRLGKIFYYKQEIAQLLLEGKKRINKVGLLKNEKSSPSPWMTEDSKNRRQANKQ